MRFGLKLGVGLAALSLSGCVYIGPEKYNQTIGCLDNDGDEATLEPNAACPEALRDCDDDDAARAPQHEEIPYDRVDQDCDSGRFDLVDVDGDGFPGISKAEWDETTRVYGDLAVWPGGLAERVDCDDNDGDVNPGIVDAPYDGIDQDCAGGDDFDADGDGFASDAYGGTDCDDSEAGVHVGADDEWYVGGDTNCDGRDDFDQDDDGFALADDCDDVDDAVFPGAVEIFYDGVDSDCAGDDDFDADGDHYHDVAWDLAYADYLVAWGLTAGDCRSATTSGGLGVCGGDDCDDADAAVHPHDLDDATAAVTERLGDAIDSDCDGGVDGATLQTGGITWKSPRGVSVANNGRHWLIGTAATSNSAESVREGGVLVWFDTSAAADVQPDSASWFSLSTPPVVGDAMDLVATADGFAAALGYRTTTASVLLLRQETWDDNAGDYRSQKTVYRQVASTQETFRSVGVATDSAGRAWAFGAADNLLAFAVGNNAAPTFSVSVGSVAQAGPTDGIVLDAVPGTQSAVSTCGGGACTTLTVDVSTSVGTLGASAAQPYAAQLASSAAQGPRARVFVPSSGTGATWLDATGTSRAVFAGRVVRRAAVDVAGSTVFAAAVVADGTGDGIDDLALAYGPVGGSLTTVVRSVVVDGTVVAPARVDLGAASGRVLLAVTGAPSDASCADPNGVECDVVAWSVLEAP